MRSGVAPMLLVPSEAARWRSDAPGLLQIVAMTIEQLSRL